MRDDELISELARPDGLIIGMDPGHSHSYTYSVAYEREKTEAEVFADALCPEDAEVHVDMASHTHSIPAGVVTALRKLQADMNAVTGMMVTQMGKCP